MHSPEIYSAFTCYKVGQSPSHSHLGTKRVKKFTLSSLQTTPSLEGGGGGTRGKNA